MNKAIPLLTLLCGFLLGVIAGPWFWPRNLMPSPPAEPAPPPQAAAVLPSPPPAPEPVAGARSENDMQLNGVFVVGDGTRSVALIQSGDGQPQPYRVDQKLPNGYTVKTIARTVVDVEKNGETISLPLVRGASGGSGETPAPEEIPPAAPVAETTNPPAPTPSRRDSVAERREIMLDSARQQPELESDPAAPPAAPPETDAAGP